MANCFYHDGVPAAANCARCAMPMCGPCLETVAGKPVCKRCVESVKAQVQAELDRNPQAAAQQAQSYQQAPQYDQGQQSNPYAQQPNQYNQQPNTYGQQSYSQPGYQQNPRANYPVQADSNSASAGRLALGVAASIFVGLLGALIWEKFTFYSGWNIGYLTALIGFGVGFAIVFVGKQGGIVPAICGAVVSLVVQVIGYYFLACDYASKDAGTTMILSLPFVITHLGAIVDPLGWFIMAVGVYGGFNMPMKSSTRAL